MPCPINSAHQRLTVTRPINGLAGSVSHFENPRRFRGKVFFIGCRIEGVSGLILSPGLRYWPRNITWVSRALTCSTITRVEAGLMAAICLSIAIMVCSSALSLGDSLRKCLANVSSSFLVRLVFLRMTAILAGRSTAFGLPSIADNRGRPMVRPPP